MFPQDNENLNAGEQPEDEIATAGNAAETKQDSSATGTDTSADDMDDSRTKIADAFTGSANVKNIENIENIEITGEALNTFMSYFPHLVVGLISLTALAGLIFIMYSNYQKAELNPAETARSLITYLVAVFTIVIALTLTLMAFFSNLKDFKERFDLGKEVLTILIGVLGTIIGFYFGSANPENKPPPDKTNQSAPANQNTNSASNANVSAVLSVKDNNSGRTPTDEQKQFAKVKEKEGFESLIAGDYDSAISAFQASEDTWSSYHNTYDIARLLRKNKTQLNEPNKKKEVFNIIVNQYSYGAPLDLLEQVKTIALK